MFLYTIQHAPEGRASQFDKETVDKIKKIAGKYFVGDMIGETGSSFACKFKGYYETKEDHTEIKTDLEHILKLSLDDLIKYKTKIYTLIKTVPDATVECVLEYRYITEMKFDDIADRLFYSRRQVMRYYNQGLDYITKILEQANV